MILGQCINHMMVSIYQTTWCSNWEVQDMNRRSTLSLIFKSSIREMPQLNSRVLRTWFRTVNILLTWTKLWHYLISCILTFFCQISVFLCGNFPLAPTIQFLSAIPYTSRTNLALSGTGRNRPQPKWRQLITQRNEPIFKCMFIILGKYIILS